MGRTALVAAVVMVVGVQATLVPAEPGAAAVAAGEDEVLQVSGRLLVTQPEGELVPFAPQSGDLEYLLLTSVGAVVELEGSPLLSGATSGDYFEGELQVTEQLADEVDPDVPVAAADDAELLAAADDAELVLPVAQGDVRTLEASDAALAHTISVAVPTPLGATATSYPDSEVDRLVSEAGEYWVSQSNGLIPGFGRVGGIARYASAYPCGAADEDVWNEAARWFGRADLRSYIDGGGDHLLVLLPPECEDAAGPGIGSVGELHLGGVARVTLGGPDAFTSAHELGHNLGLGHSNLSLCRYGVDEGEPADGCDEFEYYDAYSVMGASWAGYDVIPELPAALKRALGFHPDGAVLEVGAAGETARSTVSVTLAPVTAGAGTRAIRATDPLTGATYYVEYRSGAGRDSGAFYTTGRRLCLDPGCEAGWGSGPGVRVLSPDTLAGEAGSLVHAVVTDPDQPGFGRPALAVGEGFQTRGGGLRITVRALSAGSATVEITTGSGVTVTRIAGGDRYLTAVRAAQAGYPATAPVVYVAAGTNFPDALGAAPAAAVRGGPLLLTSPTSLPAAVADEIRRLQPRLILLVGSARAVSTEVERQLHQIAPVQRVAGADRYETARRVVRNAFGSVTAAWVASGANFPDALSAAAAAGARDQPVVLVPGGAPAVDQATLTLLRDLGVEQVRIAGSAVAVSAGIERSLIEAGLQVTRVGGATRYDTSRLISAAGFPSPARVFVAAGVTFPDALSGAALAGGMGSPLYIVPPSCVPSAMLADWTRTGVAQVSLLGSPAALGRSVETLTSC